MKSRRINQLILVLALMPGIFAINSCKKNVNQIDEIKVADFKTLSAQFKEPAKEYTTSPFFVWNADITKDEIDNFLNDFKKAGSSQVFIHPRPGLITEYLSDKWFDLYKHAVEKGKELGMNIWIYDENSYPSGFGGGHVPAQMPESYNQGQGLKMTRFETLPDTADKYYLCLKEVDGKYKDIGSSFSGEKGKTGKYLLFSKTYNGKSDWYGGFSYVDLLYQGVTQKFIEVTMSGYEKNLGSEFGKTIPGTFTDEPQINSPGGIRFTPDLFKVFKKKWRYDLKTNLPSLFEEVGDWKRIRHNYTQTLLDLFIDRWSKPWHDYCESKGLKFTGHYWEHEWPSMRPGGDNMAMYIWHQMPAIDMLFNQFNDSIPGAQFGNVRSVKELASAANQAGRSRKLSETYGGSGWDLTFTNMKRNGDWEYVLGINFMNQHLTYFTMAGARKYDYPPSFDYHEPWWNDYRYINDHFARLSLALSSGRQINNIMVLEPTTTAWLYDSYVKRDPKVAEIGQAFQSFITKLEKEQVEYDLGSENIIKTLGSVKNGKFVVGQCSYSKVVIPPMTENLDLSTFKLIRKFVSGGGTLIAFSVPELIDGTSNEEMKAFFEKNSKKIIRADKLNNEVLLKYFSNADAVFSAVKGGVLYHHTRNLADGKLVFLVNSGLTDKVSGKLSVTGRDAIEMNTLSGEQSEYDHQPHGERINVNFTINPAGSLLLFFPKVKTKGFAKPVVTGNFIPLATTTSMNITRDADNALMIDFCDVQVGGELTRDLHVFNAADKIFKFYGFKNGNPWNTSVQYKTNIVNRDTFGIKTGFVASYNFTIKGKFDYSSIKAVVERPYLWSVSINGKEIKPETGKWWLDRSFSVFNIGSLVKDGDNTITLKAVPMTVYSEVEPVYIIGNFSVEPATKGFILKVPPSKLLPGSWLTQGMPFYSWGVTYSKEFSIDKYEGKYEVSPGEWKGTVAEITVNGKPAGVIAFPPYRLDVTGFIKQGVNKIDVKVIGSLKNLLGPHHNNPAAGIASPWMWRNIKSYPAGKDYRMYDYGLFKEFALLNGK
jgi:alpha-L-rhamnosidase